MNRDFCHVLDGAIDCVSLEETTSTTSPNSCPNLWSFDQCLSSIEYNTTFNQLCPLARVQGRTNRSEDFSTMYCNHTSEEWDTLQICRLGDTNDSQSDYETFTDLPFINQSHQSYISSEEADQLEQIDIAQMEALKRYEIVGTCVTVGHALSLLSLTVAIILLFFLKRLHCTRIYIHMNLMIAFMLRGLVWILHTTAFEDSYAVDDEMSMATLYLGKRIFGQYSSINQSQLTLWKQALCDPYDKTSYYIRCRIYFVMLNYTVTANYYWLLVEGLYLGLLLLRTMNPSSNDKIIMRAFLVLGWMIPWVSVIGGVISRVLEPGENDACWFENEVGTDWWIINIPILISLLINFIIFILVVKVVGSKLKSNRRHSMEHQEDYKWRLTKSTLALIPLLGIQYLVTVFFEFIRPENATLIFVEKAFELLFTSLQGFMVAFIYCFMNGEIKEECKRCWRDWKNECEIKVTNRRRKHTTFSHTSMTNLYTGVSRKPSAISTTSTRRSESVYTLGRANGERSPRTSRHIFALSEIAEQSPNIDTRALHLSNSTETSSVVNNNHVQRKGDSRLSVPSWDNCERTSSADDDCFLSNQGISSDNETNYFGSESQNLLSKPENHSSPGKYEDYKTSIV